MRAMNTTSSRGNMNWMISRVGVFVGGFTVDGAVALGGVALTATAASATPTTPARTGSRPTRRHRRPPPAAHLGRSLVQRHGQHQRLVELLERWLAGVVPPPGTEALDERA